jgi:hypothetical protein
MSASGPPSSSAARTVILGTPKDLEAANEPESSAVVDPPGESVDDARATESPTRRILPSPALLALPPPPPARAGSSPSSSGPLPSFDSSVDLSEPADEASKADSPGIGASDLPGPPPIAASRRTVPTLTERALVGVLGLVIGLAVGGFGGYLLARSERGSAAGPGSSRVRHATETPGQLPVASGRVLDAMPAENSRSPNTPFERSPGQTASARLDAPKPGGRTVADVIAVARHQKAATKAELEALRSKLMRGGDDASAPAHYRALHDFIYDSATSVDALELLAQIPSPEGPEFLYRIWSSSTRRTPVTGLVDGLLGTKEVRDHAAPALQVLLDLRQAKSCEEHLALLGRVIESGDRRAIPALAKLQAQRGCGPRSQDDCYPCLRAGDSLDTALRAARERAAPGMP